MSVCVFGEKDIFTWYVLLKTNRINKGNAILLVFRVCDSVNVTDFGNEFVYMKEMKVRH